ncbi:MAG: hypothetical protein IMZ51_04010 [Chloroflexi bacterium]|nr:hypothetical protein [Chloroflexota bacterium]
MVFSQKAWYDDCFISIEALSGTEVQLTTKTTALGITGGGFDIEGIETFGGKITRVGSRDDIEISFDGIPASHADFDWIFAGQTTSTQSAITGAAITSSTTTKYRLAFLWTNFTGSVTSAAKQAITGSTEAYRRVYADTYCTSLETSMDAGDNLKATFTFKVANEDDTGMQNWKVESKDTTTATMTALSAYTSSVTKW